MPVYFIKTARFIMSEPKMILTPHAISKAHIPI